MRCAGLPAVAAEQPRDVVNSVAHAAEPLPPSQLPTASSPVVRHGDDATARTQFAGRGLESAAGTDAACLDSLVGAGSSHSVALLGSGQASPVTFTSNQGHAAPTLPEPSSHTCQIKGWGSNNAPGQIGAGAVTHIGQVEGDMASLSFLELGENATAITAGLIHTCALLLSGGVKCWGAGACAVLTPICEQSAPSPAAERGSAQQRACRHPLPSPSTLPHPLPPPRGTHAPAVSRPCTRACPALRQ